MSLLKEFKIKNDEVSEGLMWGGITLPSVMQQKDRSCFSVIKYDPYEKNCRTKNSSALDIPIILPALLLKFLDKFFLLPH